MFEQDDIPKHVKRASRKRKRFGVQSYSKWFKEWYTHGWYHTEKQRDQALVAVRKSVSNVYEGLGREAPQFRRKDR